MKFDYHADPRRCSGESGAALLIALGFLALMMLAGIAFVSTSLFSQKLAANSGARVQTRVLARSAAARAAFNVALCEDQATVGGLSLKNLDAASSYDEVTYNDNGTIATGALNDQLKSGSTFGATKLDYSSGNIEYSGDRSTAKWLYFYNTPQGTTGRRIIGRVAFQILPATSANLSLYGVMGGSKLVNDLGVIPQKYRWGRGVEELALDSSTVLKDSSGYVDVNNIPASFDTLYTAFSDWFTTDTDAKKAWVEEWFAEGKDTIEREVFPTCDSTGKTVRYFNRFNIGDFYYTAHDRAAKDNWYGRFGWSNPAEKKNRPAALDALTAAALEANDDDTSDTELASYGLPFLRRIGNERGSFASLELLRRQIAANFNDYCDSDSIPTGDVAAAEWSATDSSKFPAYTGNEKTLYINEIGLEIGAPELSFANETLSIEGLSVRPVGEVVNMYDNASGDALLDPANVELTLGVKTLAFKIGLSCSYTGKVTYEVVSHGVTTSYDKNFSVEINSGFHDPNAQAWVSLDGTVTRTIGGSAFSPLGGGYAAGAGDNIDLVVTSPTAYFRNKIREAAQAAVPAAGTYKSHRMTDVSVGYKFSCDDLSKVEFSPALLKAKSDGMGLDFVRFDSAGAMPLKCTAGAVGMGKARLVYSQGSSRRWQFDDTHYLGGIEARDPRQNLNPDYNHPATSDWNLVPTIVGASAAVSGNIPSMTVAVNSGSDKYVRPYKVTGGYKNRSVSPAAPKYLNASGAEVAVTDADKESATDPAWRGDTAGQHVSTAYIRNSPMVSAWELGLIHRGREWQTLNLKKAGGFGGTAAITLEEIKSTYDWSDAGTTYAAGDGAILDFIKLGTGCRSMGKLLLSRLSTAAITGSGVRPEYSRDLVKMLFDKVRVGQTMKDFYTDTVFGTPAATGGSEVVTPAAAATAFVAAVDSIPVKSFTLRSQFLNTAYGQNDSAFTFGLAGSANDALREELIGKTANLLAVHEAAPGNVFKVLIVAQSIRDVGGVNSDVPVIRRSADGDNKTLSCRIGRFDFISDAADWRRNLYFDEITGETKALATLERVPATDEAGDPNRNYGQLVVTNIEFL